MDFNVALERLQLERRTLVRPGESIEVLPFVTRVSHGSSGPHEVCHSCLDESNADRLIDEQLDHYGRLGVEFEWKLYGIDTPSDLLSRLERYGFNIGHPEALMIYDLQDGMEPFLESGNDVIQMDQVDQVTHFKAVAEAVFAKDYSFTSEELSNAIESGFRGHLGFIAYDGDKPVSVGRLYTDPGSQFSGFYGGGTLAEFRSRGHYRSVVSARAQVAAQMGVRYLQVDAMPTSQPILERLGFQKLTMTWPCNWHP